MKSRAPGKTHQPGAARAGVKTKAAQSQGGSTDDRLYAFEAAGQLLGMEDLAAEEQEAAVAGLLQPLQRQMDEQLKAAGKASAGAHADAHLLLEWAFMSVGSALAPFLCGLLAMNSSLQ